MSSRPLDDPFSLSQYLENVQEAVQQEAWQMTSLLPHRGERGSNDEAIVQKMLRQFLPRRFSIGQGFLICNDPDKASHSRQTDIIIYDQQMNAPIFSGHYSSVFPIESVYATVEVKYILTKNDLEKICQDIATIRKMASAKVYTKPGVRALTDEELSDREYDPEDYRDYQANDDDDAAGKKRPVVADEVEMHNPLAPRSFVFAFTKSGFSSIDDISDHLATKCTKDAHIHGLAVLKDDWFISQLAFGGNPPKYRVSEDNGLLRFLLSVVQGINSFPMAPASLNRYLDNTTIGRETNCSPSTIEDTTRTV